MYFSCRSLRSSNGNRFFSPFSKEFVFLLPFLFSVYKNKKKHSFNKRSKTTTNKTKRVRAEKWRKKIQNNMYIRWTAPEEMWIFVLILVFRYFILDIYFFYFFFRFPCIVWSRGLSISYLFRNKVLLCFVVYIYIYILLVDCCCFIFFLFSLAKLTEPPYPIPK